MVLSDFINFEKMWNKVKAITDFGCLTNAEVIIFLTNNEFDLSLDISECELLSDELVEFCFSKSNNDANESNCHDSYTIVHITYNIGQEEFEDYQYKQG